VPRGGPTLQARPRREARARAAAGSSDSLTKGARAAVEVRGSGRESPRKDEQPGELGLLKPRRNPAGNPNPWREQTPEARPAWPRCQACQHCVSGVGWRQSQEGRLRREVAAISARSSFEGSEPRERAWLKRYQGDRRGRKAPRSRQKRRGRNVTRAGKPGSGGSRRDGGAVGAQDLEKASAWRGSASRGAAAA
jgi:hypothetical protein